MSNTIKKVVAAKATTFLFNSYRFVNITLLMAVEIKHNITTGVVEFVTHIGGDGYSAPIVLKSDGTTQNYLYLQRDYQGSIVAISNATGQVLEKRLFDAWGNVLVQDGIGNTLSGLTRIARIYVTLAQVFTCARKVYHIQ